jgi:uncharacterized membrane protein YraQ (UPF0718 family)
MEATLAAPASTYRRDLRCYYRPIILISSGAIILLTFWFASRYPALLHKLQQVGTAMPTMAYDHSVGSLVGLASTWQRIRIAALSWLAAMAIGMSFGVLFGALLHSVLRYYPLKIGQNLYLNSLKGALVGAPMGVCANCAVPMACGITRGHGRVEVALGYLFSSPNLNPVVVMMTFAALPWYFGITKYVIVLLVIALFVPLLISFLEREKSLDIFTVDDGATCELPPMNLDLECDEKFGDVFWELARSYLSNVWMLLKPTFTIMMLASVLAALALTLVPWENLLTHVTVARAAVVSLFAVFMPVPIALDVMYAAQLQNSGVASGYVMLFLMTLGTYSIIPTIYLWREVSRRLAVILFAFFWLLGFGCALLL